jgi:hypothetical protein
MLQLAAVGDFGVDNSNELKVRLQIAVLLYQLYMLRRHWAAK